MLAVIVVLAWLAGRAGPDRPSAVADAAWVLLTSAPWAIAWLVAAVGFGWPVRRFVGGQGLAVQAGLGVATMLVLDAALGALGILQWGGSIGAWALLLAGIGLAVAQCRPRLKAPVAAHVA